MNIKTQFCIFACMACCVSWSPIQAADQQTPLDEAAAQWIEYFEAADLDGLMTLYDEDVTVALHGQPRLVGIDAVRNYFANRIGKWESRFEVEFERVETDDDFAWLMSKYWFIATVKESGQQFRDAGRSLLVYKRSKDGRWLILADIDQQSPDVTWPSPKGME